MLYTTNIKENLSKQKIKNYIIDFNLNTAIITLNINGLNTPNKRQILSDCLKQQEPTFWCL